jgi:hypothetical protein
MATLIKGIFTGKLDWQFILVGAFVAITMELCGIKALSFAVGLYLPLSTTLPIFIGGLIRGFSDWLTKRKTGHVVESDLSKGSLFATGLVAGGTILGVLIAMFTVYIDRFNREEPIENSQVVVAANQDAGAPAPEPPEQAQSGQAPKTRTVNPVTQWLEARSFKNWWTTKWDEWQKTSNPNSTAAERAATAKRWFDLMGVAWFALMGLILFVFSRRQ